MSIHSEPRAERGAGVGLGGPALDRLLRAALEEDVGAGDLTSELALPSSARARGVLRAKAAGVLAGLFVFERVLELLDPSVRLRREREDGARLSPGDPVLRLEGDARALLAGERTALNFLQHLSGVATLTRRYVDAAAGRTRILDTRKTTPGLRLLEKYAVRCGGGENHRLGLWDEAMVKDNHLDASGAGLESLLVRIRTAHPRLRITAEARTEAEALAAIAGDCDVVLLDNLAPAELRDLVPVLRAAAAGRARPLEIEASGGIDLATLEAFAGSGVDRLSIGALTHSAPALDLSLELEVVR